MWRLFLSLFCLILAGCGDIQKLILPVPQTVEADEFSVYAALITALYPDPVINSETSLSPIFSPSRLDELKRGNSQVDPLAIADFRQRNSQNYSLEDHFNLSNKPVFLSHANFSKIIGPQLDPKLFHQAFPGAKSYISFSRVGFNADRTQAVVYVDN